MLFSVSQSLKAFKQLNSFCCYWFRTCQEIDIIWKATHLKICQSAAFGSTITAMCWMKIVNASSTARVNMKNYLIFRQVELADIFIKTQKIRRSIKLSHISQRCGASLHKKLFKLNQFRREFKKLLSINQKYRRWYFLWVQPLCRTERPAMTDLLWMKKNQQIAI